MTIIGLLGALGAVAILTSQGAPATPPGQVRPEVDTVTFPLWEKATPGALGEEDVDRPTLTLYRARAQATGTAVIVAPGGGYQNLAMNHEGRQVANWLNSLGVT